VRVRIHESGQDHFASTIHLGELPAILLQPGIAERVFRFADGNDLSAEAQHGGVFDDAWFFEARAATGTGVAGARDTWLTR